ncbi:MAG TPA: hypothetical protein VFU93_02640 [Acidimicrobiales bacterium]|nr:hypothetical protein [Acidimicrobiales bacterium]
MQAFATASAGFLLAVLWFDLMHDVLARGDVSDDDLGTIQRYYRRVTTDAFPMNRLVLVAMVCLLASIVAELAGDSVPAWAPIASLVLALPPIVLSRKVVRMAKALSTRAEAKTILRDHVFCFVCIGAVLAVQLASLA